MKKLLLSILIFNTFVTHIIAQENKEKIELDEIEILSSPRIQIESSQNSISVLTISQEQINNSTATNISELFDKDSLVSIDINDVRKSIRTIENVLESNLYENNFNQLLDSKNKVLTEFNLHSRLNKLVEENISINASPSEEVTLHSSNYYWKKTTSNKKKIKRILKRKLRLY